MDTDVLIVGAGPTGLMLANQLARRGVRTLVIERHAGPSLQTRALGVQARTLEIYSHLGIAERAIALGKRGTGARMWASGRPMAFVPLGEAGAEATPYPYILVLGQDDNERLMGERLRDHGVEVQWNTGLAALEQRADHVVATLTAADGSTRKVAAQWVAGCDGSRSAVRELSGIAFPGAPYEQVFFVADVQATGSMVSDEVNVFLWRSGFHLFFPMRGADHWRIVGILPKELRDRDGLALDDVVGSLRGEAGTNLSFSNCSWFSTYRIHHRHAERFRQGRCFVLGDAAHVHSPVGAQGMNTGLQDAYNLAWKLSLVVKNKAGQSLLDSYEAERLPIARRLLSTTDRGFQLVVSDHPLAGILRTKILARIGALAMRFKSVQRLVFRTVSQTGLHYRSSALSATAAGLPAKAPQAGDRFPWLHLALHSDGAVEDSFRTLDDTHFHLLLFGQSVPQGATAFGDLLRIHHVPQTPGNTAEMKRHGIPERSFYLLRPDGHVGLCGKDFSPARLEGYARESLGLARVGMGRIGS